MHAVLEMASCSRFVVLELPQPAVCRIHFSIASFWCRLLLVLYHMTWKAEVSDSAVQSTMVLREPVQTTEKWRWKNFSVLCAERLSLRASIHYLWQWPYHSKIPRVGAEFTMDCVPSSSYVIAYGHDTDNTPLLCTVILISKYQAKW